MTYGHKNQGSKLPILGSQPFLAFQDKYQPLYTLPWETLVKTVMKTLRGWKEKETSYRIIL